MITREEALNIAREYLKKKNREFTYLCSIEEIKHYENESIRSYDDREIVDNVWSILYYMPWGLEEKSIYISISEKTGEVYGSLGPHGLIEDFENDEI